MDQPKAHHKGYIDQVPQTFLVYVHFPTKIISHSHVYIQHKLITYLLTQLNQDLEYSNNTT